MKKGITERFKALDLDAAKVEVSDHARYAILLAADLLKGNTGTAGSALIILQDVLHASRANKEGDSDEHA
jgi:hypothetical protein